MNDSFRQISYKYASFGIWMQTAMLSPLYILSIWLAITSEITLFIILGAVFIGAINLFSLLRLRETIIVSENGITKKTPSSEIYISWKDAALVKTYISWAERHCFKIESISGDRITVSEMLVGYDQLYAALKDKFPQTNSRGKFVKFLTSRQTIPEPEWHLEYGQNVRLI